MVADITYENRINSGFFETKEGYLFNFYEFIYHAQKIPLPPRLRNYSKLGYPQYNLKRSGWHSCGDGKKELP
jgi:hypothetical protein